MNRRRVGRWPREGVARAMAGVRRRGHGCLAMPVDCASELNSHTQRQRRTRRLLTHSLCPTPRQEGSRCHLGWEPGRPRTIRRRRPPSWPRPAAIYTTCNGLAARPVTVSPDSLPLLPRGSRRTQGHASPAFTTCATYWLIPQPGPSGRLTRSNPGRRRTDPLRGHEGLAATVRSLSGAWRHRAPERTTRDGAPASAASPVGRRPMR
jgi:hypothetical protein